MTAEGCLLGVDTACAAIEHRSPVQQGHGRGEVASCHMLCGQVALLHPPLAGGHPGGGGNKGRVLARGCMYLLGDLCRQLQVLQRHQRQR